MSTQQKRKFFKDVKHYFWEDPFHLKSVRIKLFDVVFLAKKPMTSSWLAIMVPPVDITVLTTQQEKSSIPDSFGPQSTKMPIDWLTLQHRASQGKISQLDECHKLHPSLKRIFKKKSKKKAKSKQFQAREGKDQVKSKSKVIRMKILQLEGLKLTAEA
ncbi:hypothetical protein Tco_1293955 [Tanacetum coccineum]